jgi:anti-sigma regulatory factor (Ser/Thr protein kinase)
MKEISLHILDIVQNSITAGAKNIKLELLDLELEDLVCIVVSDDGAGMSEEFLQKVTDPFTTSRTTRNVGLGIPLLKSAALMTGGDFDIKSKQGTGTVVSVGFKKSNIDCPPLGDITGTIITLIQGSPDINLIVSYKTDKGEFTMDTAVFKNELGDIPLNEPEVLTWIEGWFKEALEGVDN